MSCGRDSCRWAVWSSSVFSIWSRVSESATFWLLFRTPRSWDWISFEWVQLSTVHCCKLYHRWQEKSSHCCGSFQTCFAVQGPRIGNSLPAELQTFHILYSDTNWKLICSTPHHKFSTFAAPFHSCVCDLRTCAILISLIMIMMMM